MSPTLRRPLLAALAALLILPTPARANPETNIVDLRSTAMGGTGISSIDSPSAVALNPANLARTEHFGFQVGASFGLGQLSAPVGGPDMDRHTPWLLVPTPALFAPGRVSDRVVLGGGVYVASLFGGSYPNVDVLLGDDLNPPTDYDVTFGNFEVGLSVAVELTDQLDLGATLRIPYAFLDTHQPQVLLAQTVLVQQELRGFGFPAGRIGLAYRPTEEISLGLVYRTQASTPMNGTVSFDSMLIDALFGGTLRFDGTTKWRLPNAIEVGGSARLLDQRLVLAADYGVYFFKATHEALVLEVDDPEGQFQILTGGDEVELPLDWRTSHVLRVGVEFAASDLVAIRAGFSANRTASVDRTAQFFTPPPGFLLSEFVGLGLSPGDFQIDLVFGHSYGHAEVAANAEQCQSSDDVKVGCPGTYTARGLLAGASLTYRR